MKEKKNVMASEQLDALNEIQQEVHWMCSRGRAGAESRIFHVNTSDAVLIVHKLTMAE